MKQVIILSLALVILAVASGHADRRQFVWTYQPVTVSPGEAEFEFYQTTKLDRTNSWEYRVEFEQGLSPRADLAFYQIFTQADEDNIKWDAFQIRARYRLAEPGELFLNPVAYLEYRRKLDLKEQNKLEAKLILGDRFDRVVFAANPLYELFWAPGDPVHEIGLDLGLGYELSHRFSISLESVSRHEFLKNAENETSAYFGPTFSFASGSVFYTAGYAWGLTDDSNDARVRFLLGVSL